MEHYKKLDGAENGIRTHGLLQEWISHWSQAIDLNDLESTAVDRAWLSRHVRNGLSISCYIAVLAN